MMTLENLLKVIKSDLEFELYKGNRIGVFNTEDIGLEKYLDDEVNGIEVDNKRLVICLD